jgi:glycosyltransferase involved in cell wall biosynthesis
LDLQKAPGMISLVLPQGHMFGWGVCGRYLTRELARFSPVALLSEPFTAADIGDELDYRFLQQVRTDPPPVQAGTVACLPHPMLQAITDHCLLPLRPDIRGTRTVGYTFFEHTFLAPHHIASARQFFDVIVAGSSWCEDILKCYQLPNTCTILQGVDQTLFNPYENHKRLFEDAFVVFSGGKFELRKGQDIVIKAFKIFHDKYKDVLLINAWFNHWLFSVQTMAVSPHIAFQWEGGDYCTVVNSLLAANGIDLERVITLPPQANAMMAKVYKNTDCGLFPNRCEGGSNLVLMEYMACGKPAIVSNTSGHRDVADATHALMLQDLRPITISQDEQAVAMWDEPSIDETLAQLEWAYHHRDALRALGAASGTRMQAYTWQAAAAQFYALMARP